MDTAGGTGRAGGGAMKGSASGRRQGRPPRAARGRGGDTPARRRRPGVRLGCVAAAVLCSGVLSAGLAARSVAARDPSAEAAARTEEPRRAARAAGCTLFGERARAATSADCLVCHGRGGIAAQRRACHPVAIDYAGASRSRSSLRPIDEVVRRGVLLPGNELRCVTCHDARSPWAHAVALPPGATPALAVDAARSRRREPGRAPPPPAPGDRVDAQPLCVVCHLLG